MRLPPFEVLLSWPTPNYVNPVTRGHALVVVNSVFLSIVIITVGLRLYTRIFIRRWFGLDDIFILIALLFTIGLTSIVLLANRDYGWDRHAYDIPVDKFEPTAKLAMTVKIIFTAAATFTRLSLHCFYYRLVAGSDKKWFKWLVHANVIYTLAIFISFTFIAIFLCNPVNNYWNLGAPADTCMDDGIVTLACGVINSVADLATTITPIPLVLRLHMPCRQRFAVTVLFGMGFIVTIAGIVRTWYIYISLIKSYDQTWYTYPLCIAAAVEIDLGVICASAPVLQALLASIPFSLSKTFVCGMSIRKWTSHTSSLEHLTGSGSPLGASVVSSSRQEAVPTVLNDKVRGYELKHWDDAERRIMAADDGESG